MTGSTRIPTVTIGVTTFNAADSIRAALESAFEQTWPMHQFVVVDDCSTDTTMAVLGEYAGRPGFEVYQNPENSGVAVSRNEIVNRATGEFIVFFDDDDISSPDRVQKQVTRILEYEAEFAGGAPVVCHTARTQIYPDGSQRLEPTMGQRTGQKAPAGPAVARRALMGEPLEDAYGSCATCSQAARTETYRQLGGFDERLRRCEDTDLAIRLALSGGHFVGIAEPLVTQKMTGTSDKSLDKLKELFLMVIDKHRAVFGADDVYAFCRKWASLKFDWLAGRRARFALGLAALGAKHPVLTWRRIRMALPNFSHNRAFRRFSRNATEPTTTRTLSD